MLSLALYICIITDTFYSIEGHNLWKKVIVDDLHFQNSNSPSILGTSALLPLHCGVSCDQNPDCTAWCHDGQTCSLTNFLISPLHVATYVGDTKTCFTNLERDFIFGSSVTYSATHPGYPTKTPSNFVRGIFDNCATSTCSSTPTTAINPWMLFDFGDVKQIREVRIMTQNYVYAADLAHGAQIKIGNSLPVTDGDFSAFRNFGELPNPVVEFTVYVVKRDRPMKGRYLSIQKQGNPTMMTLCYVMAL